MNEGAGLLSVREISRRTGVPESTLRYYRKLFANYIPTVGSGRGRRHPEEAVAVFQRISRLFAAGESHGAILRELERGRGVLEPATGYVSERPPAVEVTPAHELAIAEHERQVRFRDMEKLLTAMMVRDRELVSMHRDLLELLEKLIHTLGSLAAAWASVGARETSEAEMAIPAAAAEAEPERPARDSLELERLRESLARECETVERLRRARLELEQRLARLEREESSRGRRR
jgi:DNA-binding transcriptional MerR regulator